MFNLGLSHLWGGEIRRVLYSERKITTIGMAELPEFVESFRNYGFNYMMRAPGKYSEVLIHEFYAKYKELQQ